MNCRRSTRVFHRALLTAARMSLPGGVPATGPAAEVAIGIQISLDGGAAATRALSGLACLCVAVTLLTAALAVPVLLAPNERIFGTEIVGRHHDPYTVMLQFAGAPVPAPYLQPATDWIGRALASVMSPVAAFNVVVLWTFPLTAAFTFLFAYEITRSVPASAMAGLLCAFAPFHMAHAAYHPHIAQVQWTPLYFFALWRCLRGITGLRASMLAASLSLVLFSNYYGGFIALTMTVAAVPLFWLAPSPERRERAWRDLALTSMLMFALCAAALAIAHAIVPNVFEHGAPFAVSRSELFMYSARWWAYLVPPVEHPVLGWWSQQVWDSHGIESALLEQQVYIGFGVLTLAAIALWTWGQARDRSDLGVVPFLTVIAAIALLCSLSPERQIFGVRFVRPSALLYVVAPMFRSYARFGVVVQLMIAIVAGVGLTSLWQRRASRWNTRAARTAAVVLAAVTVFEYMPVPWRWHDVLPTSAHRWLVRKGQAPRVFDCSDSSPSEQATPWLAGYPLGYLEHALPDCGEPDLAARLRTAGFTHLLVRAPRPEFGWLTGHAQKGLRPTYRADDSAVFDVTVAQPVTYVATVEGLHPREYSQAWTWRWTSGDATLQVENLSGAPYTAALDVELASFGIERHVVVWLNERHVTSLVVQSHRAMYRIGPMQVPPGRHQLRLRSVEAPIVAKTLEHNNDSRLLAIALGKWRWTP
jgi:hypothetical protein